MTWIAYFLAAMWGIGCLAAAITTAIFLYHEESPLIAGVCLFLGLPLAIVVGLLPVSAIAHYNETETIKLSVDEWYCTAQVHRKHATTVLVGKVLVHSTSYRTSCTQYNLKD